MRNVLFLILLLAAAPVRAAEIVDAAFDEPTTRYDHGVLGDAVEWGALRLALDTGESRLIRLPETRVFEDLAPRLITGDAGQRLAMVVESDLAEGARLALYGPDGLYAATPFIGQAHRWLAPIGAGDLDGDGRIEIAYIDRPHLARTLRVWRLEGGRLTEIARLEGFTNHRIGWDYILGGLRSCDAGAGPEMVLATGDWAGLVAVRLAPTGLSVRGIGSDTSPAGFAAALACE